MRFPPISVVVLGVAVTLVACDREDPIEVYTAPKEPPAVAPRPAAHAHTPAPAPRAATLTWTLPEGWTQLPGDQWVEARFQIEPPDPDVTLTASRLIHSPLIDNVNRWLGQMNLPPVAEADLPKLTTRVDANGLAVDVVRLTSPTDRMVCAVTTLGPEMWFFKLSGPADKVAAQEKRFDAFVGSLNVQAPAASTSASADATWTMPPGWHEDPEKKDFRVVAFHVGDARLHADVVVSSMGKNQVGSLADNIIRWRRQVGLPPADPSAHPPKDARFGELAGQLYDITNPTSRQRVMVLWVDRGDQAWFFRIDGPHEAIEAHFPAFTEFLQSFRFTRP